MPTLLEMAAQLTGEIPGLSRLYAAKYVNQAMSDVREERLWSWNIGEGILIVPQALSNAGLVNVVHLSNLVQFDSTAQAVLTPLQLANPPITEYQFRLGGGPVYSLIGYDATTGVGTLDRLYGEATVSGSMYAMYRCYYDPPSIDGVTPNHEFLRFLTINNNIQGYAVSGRRLYMTREELNRRDPLRGAQGYPYFVSQYQPTYNRLDSATTMGQFDGQMQFELWPHPTYSMSLLCQYEKKHVDMKPTDWLPRQAPTALVRYRAFEHAYRWALQNSGRISELKGVDWRFALSEVEKKYQVELVKAKRQDNEIMNTILHPGMGQIYDFAGPIDSNFFQSHGLPML